MAQKQTMYSKLLEDTPLKYQLRFIPVELDTSDDSQDKMYVNPTCIQCQCRIYQHFWSSADERYRRTGLRCYEQRPLRVGDELVSTHGVPNNEL